MAYTADNFPKAMEPNTEEHHHHGDNLAQPKGVQTRAAISMHLAEKLKLSDAKMDLAALILAEQDMQMNQESKDQFWDANLKKEREKITENREAAESELQAAIQKEKFDKFNDLDNPIVVMMTHDL